MDIERRAAQKASEQDEKELFAGLSPKEYKDARKALEKVKKNSEHAKKYQNQVTYFADLTMQEKQEVRKAVQHIRETPPKKSFFSFLFRKRNITGTKN